MAVSTRRQRTETRMIRQLIVSLTTAGLSAGLIVAASAADLSRPASAPVYTKAPLAPAPYSWTGFYIGADAGYGWGRSTESFADPGNAGFDACGQCEGPWDPQNVKATSNSFLGGLYAGYNWQLVPNWLVGVEGDFTWTHLKNSSATALSQPAPGPGSTTFQSSLNLETTVNWLASARARAG